jgi:hypothetical protein
LIIFVIIIFLEYGATMSLSITGNLLTGPFLRPDLTFPDDFKVDSSVDIKIDGSTHAVKQVAFTLSGCKTHWSNLCGYIPGIGTLTGFGRAFLGLVHLIVHLIKAFFDQMNRAGHLAEAALGFYSLIRGLIEMIPGVGTLILAPIDIYRVNKAEREYFKKLLGARPV